MELMEKILSRENMLSALKAVKRNKGAAGIDKVTVDELDEYFSGRPSNTTGSCTRACKNFRYKFQQLQSRFQTAEKLSYSDGAGTSKPE